jgi:hypothetical protein
MKSLDVWEVRWSNDDRGSTYKIVYVSTLDLAITAASNTWGYCGGKGDTRRVTLEVAETTDDVAKLATKTHFS